MRAACCHVVGGITTDKELGKFLVDNGLWGNDEALTEETYKALDYNAIGREHRLDEGGTFTANAYVEQHSDLIEAHQSIASKPPTPDYTILLEVRNNSQNSNEEAVPLKLPAIESELDDTLEQLGTATWTEVGFRCLDCKAPMLTDLIYDAADISEINQLAAALAEMPQKQLTEYKAILTATRCSEFDSAVQLLGSMEDYIVTREYETMGDVARDELHVIMPTESIDLMLPYLDLDGYGQALVKELNADLTAYGMVERKDRQPVYVLQEQPQSNGIQMM